MLSKYNSRFTKSINSIILRSSALPITVFKHNIPRARLYFADSDYSYNPIDKLTKSNNELCDKINKMNAMMIDINKSNEVVNEYNKNKIKELQDIVDKYKSLGDVNELKDTIEEYNCIRPNYIHTVNDPTISAKDKRFASALRIIILICAGYMIVLNPELAIWLIIFKYSQRTRCKNDHIGIAFITFVTIMAVMFITKHT